MAGSTPEAPSMVATSDVLAMLRRIQRHLVLLTGAVLVAGGGIGLAVSGTAGLWGALMAAGLGLVFTLTTLATLRLVAGRDMMLLPVALLGGWLIKIVLVFIALLWLRDQDFYDRGVFFVTLVVMVLGAVVVEIGAIATSRVPYVQTAPVPAPADDEPSGADAPAGSDAPIRAARDEPGSTAAPGDLAPPHDEGDERDEQGRLTPPDAS